MESMRPEQLVETLFAFVRTAVLKAAVDLELFTHIARGRRSADEIAGAANADGRATRVVLDALVAQGFLGKREGGYSLNPVTEMLLVKDSPSYAGDFSRIITNPRLWQAMGELAAIVRTGTPPEAMIEVPDHEFWVEFGEASEKTSQLPAGMLADMLDGDRTAPLEVLDVACGSGVYGFSVLERFPQARLTSLDWPSVLNHARKVAERRGVAQRITWLGGSAFEATLPPSRFDLVIVSHFYHHFPAAQNIELSKRLFAALKPGGRISVHDWVADDARAERTQALMFAVVMVASTPQGDVYTLPEYRSMLEAAGFRGVRLEEIPLMGTHVVFAERPSQAG
jgi:ubiquinone/menaquinone biosynthesis C-methylase UbiE